MSSNNERRPIYSSYVTGLAVIGCIITSITLFFPYWGFFINSSSSSNYNAVPQSDKGNFGLWTICKDTPYDQKCNNFVTKFKPIDEIAYCRNLAIISMIVICIVCVLNVLHLAMLITKDKVLFQFKINVILKLIASIVAVFTSVGVGVLFAIQIDHKSPKNIPSYQVIRGWCFYIHIVDIIINFLIFFASIYDCVYTTKKLHGDPTIIHDPTCVNATTFNNPGFKFNGNNGISMTVTSGKPYSSAYGANGSTVSMSTMISSAGSTVTSYPRAPLRSSLKKPKVATTAPGLGISNPGFSRSSPPLGQDIKKKVRIQTISTEV